MQSWQHFSLHRGALRLAVGVGTTLMLVVTAATALSPLGAARGFGEALVRLALIYGATGVVAAWGVERAEQQHGRGRRFAPPGMHAYLAAHLVAVAHACVLALVHHGDFANLAFFGAEAFVVTVLAGVVGGLTGEALRASETATS